ncbi:hydroxyacylglutathione hydrolase [Oxalobacter sp. OttesenSCG-928-P03]|nr:hydroxyacylglutathione hydrolase [Oxalobacter sp. OttesenSCG-928-P03]
MADLSEQTLHVTALPAFNDNYIWLIDNGTHAVVIDPGEAEVVMTELKKRALSLSAILLTHRHDDHISGVPRLLTEYDTPVYGPKNDDIIAVTHPLEEGSPLTIEALGLSLTVMDVPGHTRGHIAYYARMRRWLFCGDMLFGAGCGRMLEGTPEMMIASLAKFTALPDDTLVFCAHEYTLSNLKFALEIEPDNPDILQRMRDDSAKRDQMQPTLPSTMALEKKTNPFLRNMEPDVLERLLSLGLIKSKNTVDAFAAMREWKNIYR